MLIRSRVFHMLVGMIILELAILICGRASNIQADERGSKHDGIIYRNPRVYNVEYTFEIFPDPNKVDRDKDLKLWVPIPREWDSQKAVKIVSVEPEPHGKYVDPEHGNPMLFWDFGKEPKESSYKVNLKCRLEQYETYADIDPNRIAPYDKTSKDYTLYTRSTHTISITNMVKELAAMVVGNEKNPYLQAKLIYEFVREKMCYRGLDTQGKPHTVEILLKIPQIEPKTGQEYYLGICFDQSMVYVALCRAVGIPARNILARWDNNPWNRTTPEHPEPAIRSGEKSNDGLTHSWRRGLDGHGWAEIYLPNYGWIPVDPTFGQLGHSNVNNRFVIITKEHDIQIDPRAVQEGDGKYGEFGWHLHEGRIAYLMFGVCHTSTIQSIRTEILNHPDPFPADALAEYAAKLYPEAEAEKNIALYRKRTLRWLDQNTREHEDKIVALAEAYKKEHRARYDHEAFICHMLRQIVGNKRFFNIVETYTNLRVKSGEPVSTARFQKIAEEIYGQPLGWFFKQWIGYTELPQLQLDGVTFSKNEDGWHVRGNLRQLNMSLFRLPVGLTIETEKASEHKTIWLEGRSTDFEFSTTNRPTNVVADPNNDILQIREMPPLLEGSSYDEIAFCTITDQDKADWYDWTPLHFAAQAGRTEVVEYFVSAGADINAETIRGETPLQFAAAEGHKEIVKFLIANGADISLHIAARLGDLDTVKSLIEDVNDINAKDARGRTPLSYAAEEGRTEIAELLLAKGADVNMRGKKYPPLSWAVWSEDREMIKLLVTGGADVNFAEDDWPYLHYVAEINDRELVELLLTHGANLNVKDDSNRTALHIALSRGHRDMAEFLISKGATGPELHLAACLGNLERVKSFVEEGIDVDTKDEAGWAPLYWAVSTGQEDVVEFLIEKGADINIKTKDNRTLLHQAARSGAVELTKLLISMGADPNTRDDDNSTPLHSAAASGHENVVELLITKDAEIKAEDKSGNTPLHVAARSGHVDVVEVLLAHRADINKKNKRGRTALNLASNNDHTEIVELLQKHEVQE